MKNPDAYFLSIAEAVSQRADCMGRHVGAVLVRDNRIISTGYNGTPSGVKNCTDGGCFRCKNREKFPEGTAYDICLCVHAEANAILVASKFGINTSNTIMYTTLQPCFACAKEMLQAGIKEVIYKYHWTSGYSEYYDDFIKHFKSFRSAYEPRSSSQ